MDENKTIIVDHIMRRDVSIPLTINAWLKIIGLLEDYKVLDNDTLGDARSMGG